MKKKFINLNIAIINVYKYFFSPLLGNNCRYSQSCSDYYIGSLRGYGFLNGSFMGLKRIMSCHPIKFLGGGSSFDTVPERKKIKEKI